MDWDRQEIFYFFIMGTSPFVIGTAFSDEPMLAFFVIFYAGVNFLGASYLFGKSEKSKKEASTT